MLNKGTLLLSIPLTKCAAYIPVQAWSKHRRHISFWASFFFFIRKEQLQNFGKIVNQQLHLYKNTFVIFSVCQQSGTADPEHFFHTPNSLFGSWGENMILELVLFWNVFRLYVSVASLAWRLDLSAERCVGVEPYEAPHGTGASGSHQKASGHMAQRSPPPFV